MEFSLTTADGGTMTVATVTGEIDVYTAPQLRQHLDRQIGMGRVDLILDLREVTYLDSTGLGVLVGRLKEVRAWDGSLSIVCTSERLLQVFAVTGLDKVFPIFDSIEAATARGGVR